MRFLPSVELSNLNRAFYLSRYTPLHCGFVAEKQSGGAHSGRNRDETKRKTRAAWAIAKHTRLTGPDGERVA
jgi:hypothetical protein